jgi:hypothetical protein
MPGANRHCGKPAIHFRTLQDFINNLLDAIAFSPQFLRDFKRLSATTQNGNMGSALKCIGSPAPLRNVRRRDRLPRTRAGVNRILTGLNVGGPEII